MFNKNKATFIFNNFILRRTIFCQFSRMRTYINMYQSPFAGLPTKNLMNKKTK